MGTFVPVTISVSLSAVIVAVTDDDPRVLVVDRGSQPPALPAGPLPDDTATLDLGLRGWVRDQTGFELCYVEQLYTFGDLHRDRSGTDRHLAIAYLALVREAVPAADARWVDAYALFPWEDHRNGPPPSLTGRALPALEVWSTGDQDRSHRVRLAFGSGVWDGYRSLERYELLYEAGLVAEWHLDRDQPVPDTVIDSQALVGDHRRIAATALGRLRGKLTYRPVVFELLPEAFTLRSLQRVVEALAGEALHTQNLRRLVESARLVEPTGDRDEATGGRPASLHRFRAEVLLERPRPGITRPGA